MLSNIYLDLKELLYMRAILVGKKYSNERIDNVLKLEYKGLSTNSMYKAFRKRDVKVNGKRVKFDFVVSEGDKIEIFVPDQLLMQYNLSENTFSTLLPDIIYEDKNIIIVCKKAGMSVHPDKYVNNYTLIDMINEYLGKSKAFLCHRIDRNTAGLLIVAKNANIQKQIQKKMETREIKKYYECLVNGKMAQKEEIVKAYLKKDAYKSKVLISDIPRPGYSEIITKYKVLSERIYTEFNQIISKLEVELITGKTHQIRAHLAHLGNAIIGDGKYGINKLNKALGAKYQELWSYKITFKFNLHKSTDIDYLNGKVFEVKPKFLLE